MAHPFPAADGSSPQTRQFSSEPEMGIDPSKRYTATMETNLGTIVIALDAAAAPKTVNNFVFLANYHYFDGVIFHRIIRGFVCQGGAPPGTGPGAWPTPGPAPTGASSSSSADRTEPGCHRSTRCSARS